MLTADKHYFLCPCSSVEKLDSVMFTTYRSIAHLLFITETSEELIVDNYCLPCAVLWQNWLLAVITTILNCSWSCYLLSVENGRLTDCYYTSSNDCFVFSCFFVVIWTVGLHCTNAIFLSLYRFISRKQPIHWSPTEPIGIRGANCHGWKWRCICLTEAWIEGSRQGF
jgi:hypothetical protein